MNYEELIKIINGKHHDDPDKMTIEFGLGEISSIIADLRLNNNLDQLCGLNKTLKGLEEMHKWLAKN